MNAHTRREFLLWLAAAPAFPAFAAEEPGFVSMFNGKDLDGWEGKPGGWWVEDGLLTAASTKEKPCLKHHYLYWKGGTPGDFMLRFDYRLVGEGGNSGVQIRSETRPDWDTWGYQADIENGPQWTGCLFQHDRMAVVTRGVRAKISTDGKREETRFAAADDLQKLIHRDDWNAYEVIANSHHIALSINGHLMCEVDDCDAKFYRDKGIIALQMHPGPPMKIQFRNLRIRILENAR